MEQIAPWDPKNLAYTEDAELIAQAVTSLDYTDRHYIALNVHLSAEQISELYDSLSKKDYLSMERLLQAPNCSPGFLHKVLCENHEFYVKGVVVHPNALDETKVLSALYRNAMDDASEWTTR